MAQNAPSGGSMVLQTTQPPKWNKSMLKSESERICFYQAYQNNVKACEAASTQSGVRCTPVPRRLCIGIKALEGALLVGTFQRNLMQPRLTVENVKEGELKRWLKPERDQNRKVSNRELEKVLAKSTWNYSSSVVFTVDLLLQLVAEAMLDTDIGHLLGEDPERRPDAIVRIVIDKIGHEEFKECMEAAYERNTENTRKEWAVFVKLMRENAAKMDSCHIRNFRPNGGSARDRSSQSVQHDQAKDRPIEKNRETPFCLNKKTCDGKKHFLKDCPSTSNEEAHQLFDERRQPLKVRRAKIKEAKAEKRRKLERVKKAKIMQQHEVRKCKSAIRFMLEGMLIDAATEDTGADATVVPDKVVAKMEQRGLAVERIKLEKALVFKTAELKAPRLLAEQRSSSNDLHVK
jgi:hypothetical protein